MLHHPQFLQVIRYANDSRCHVHKVDVSKKLLTIAHFEKPEDVRSFTFDNATSLEFPHWAKKAIDELSNVHQPKKEETTEAEEPKAPESNQLKLNL